MQRPDSGTHVDDPRQSARVHPLHERVHPQPHLEIEQHRPVLDEEVLVAGAAEGEFRKSTVRFPTRQDAVLAVERDPPQRMERRCGAGLDPVAVGTQLHRSGGVDGHERHGVSGPELTDLPALRLTHDDGAHEAAEARAIRAQDDRHVAGEVDRSHGVRGVVDVRRMQTGLAAVDPGPLRPGSHQPHAGSRGVVVHGPPRREERLDVRFGEELRSGMRAHQHAHLPVGHEERPDLNRDRRRRRDRGRRRSRRNVMTEPQHVARAQRPSAVAAEATEGERGGAAEVSGHVDAAPHQQVGPQAGTTRGADGEGRPGGHLHGFPEANGRDRAVTGLERGRYLGSGEHDGGR